MSLPLMSAGDEDGAPRATAASPGAEEDSPSFRLLSPDHCYELLATTVVGRVAFLAPTGLQLLPVNYRVLERSVLISTSAGGTLAGLATHHGEVVFEVDYHAPLARHGWSVVLRATSAPVRDPLTLAAAARLRLVPWAPVTSAIVLRLRPHQVTGREVSLRGPRG